MKRTFSTIIYLTLAGTLALSTFGCAKGKKVVKKEEGKAKEWVKKEKEKAKNELEKIN
jgi:hypothetical protein